MDRNGAEAIDPILQIMKARNGLMTAIAHMQEFHGADREIIRALKNADKSINLIHRWYLRNPDALSDFVYF